MTGTRGTEDLGAEVWVLGRVLGTEGSDLYPEGGARLPGAFGKPAKMLESLGRLELLAAGRMLPDRLEPLEE